MFDSTDAGHEGACQVRIARNAVFSIALWLRKLEKLAPKRGWCGGSAVQDVAKICTTLWRERFGNQNRYMKLKVLADVIKLHSAKFAKRRGARSVWKS